MCSAAADDPHIASSTARGPSRFASIIGFSACSSIMSRNRRAPSGAGVGPIIRQKACMPTLHACSLRLPARRACSAARMRVFLRPPHVAAPPSPAPRS